MAVSVPGLPVLHRYRFRFVAEQPIALPPYPGSAWRGLLGHGLRKVACVVRRPSCDGCPLLESCVYNRVFESRVTSDGRYQLRPHPFVLDVDAASDTLQLNPGDSLGFRITLFDPVRDALPYLIHGLSVAGSLGIGAGHGTFSLRGVDYAVELKENGWRPIWSDDGGEIVAHDSDTRQIPAQPGIVTIRFLTPFRLKERGRLVGPREFGAEHLLRALWRRARDVSRFYGDPSAVPLPREKPDGMTIIHKELRWHDWRRYSSRQKEAMNMGGVVGSFSIADERLAQWWPLIWYGQWLQVGKATSMGLGRYIVENR